MSPQIRWTDGSTIWNGAEASPEFVIERGSVVYAKSVEDAERHSRAGSHPLVLRAIGRDPNPFNADPVLSDVDGTRLLDLAKRDGFLRRYNVVFLMTRRRRNHVLIQAEC